MKKIFGLLFSLILIPVVALASTATWTPVTSYTDGSAISVAKQAEIVYHIFCDNAEFASVTGVGTWKGTIPQARGETKTYHLTAELDGMTSDPGPSTLYFYPVLSPGSPGTIIIQLGGP